MGTDKSCSPPSFSGPFEAFEASWGLPRRAIPCKGVVLAGGGVPGFWPGGGLGSALARQGPWLALGGRALGGSALGPPVSWASSPALKSPLDREGWGPEGLTRPSGAPGQGPPLGQGPENAPPLLAKGQVGQGCPGQKPLGPRPP